MAEQADQPLSPDSTSRLDRMWVGLDLREALVSDGGNVVCVFDEHMRLPAPVLRRPPSSRTRIDITGLERAAVLAVLYNHTKPSGQGGGSVPFAQQPLTTEDAQGFIDVAQQRDVGDLPNRDTMYLESDGSLSIGYLWGHSLKLIFDGDVVDVTVYDIDNGALLGAEAIAHLRATGSTVPAAG
ncbi:hypothetical protein [Streptomyces sp. NPDC050988]|uniref:hypothetical protein n=1 Tax=Streptomyces sp. NPDC050988 TaxID=3365637 RepID=UPI0037B0DADD